MKAKDTKKKREISKEQFHLILAKASQPISRSDPKKI